MLREQRRDRPCSTHACNVYALCHAHPTNSFTGAACTNHAHRELQCFTLHQRMLACPAGAILGLGLAYAGTCRAEVAEVLSAVVEDGETAIEVAGWAALSLGLVYQVCAGPGL